MLNWGTIYVSTLGQAVYLAVIANPDGLASDELVSKLQEAQSHLTLDEVTCAAETLRGRGYIRHDHGRWYAPGPTPAIWEAL